MNGFASSAFCMPRTSVMSVHFYRLLCLALYHAWAPQHMLMNAQSRAKRW